MKHVVHKFTPQEVDNILDPHTAQVISLLQKAKIPVRIVGGAVRDMLRGLAPRDVDLVADASPSMLIYLFQAHDWPVDTGGIQHGTVKAVFGTGDSEQKVDVSSLGYRISRHGHDFQIKFTHSWEVDSGLRDLTINSMSMDVDGHVYDYQNGYADLKNQIVKLGPHADDSLLLDPAGMMRYFRALSQFTRPKVIHKDLEFIKKQVHVLADVVDDKKVQMNMISILKSPHRQNALKIMCAMHVHKYLPYAPCEPDAQ